MHRYHLADVCTMLRFVCVGILISWAFLHSPVAWALAIFVFGELMDALDGGLALRYPYPDDGKYRWWRDACDGRLPEIYDQVVDILLALAVLLYVGLNIHLGLALWIAGVGACIAVPVQIWRAWRIRLIPDEDDDLLRQRVIRIRRLLYLFAIGVVIVEMIIALPVNGSTKLALVIGGGIVAVVILALKIDRLKRDKPKKS